VCIGILVAHLGVAPSVASAQTKFPWPDTAVDVSTYTTVDECLSATRRVAESESKRQRLATGVWPDTMPFDPQRALRPLPEVVVQTASRCAARFVGPAAPLDEFVRLLELYLLANRDADAAALVARRVDAEKTDRARASVLDTVFTAYIGAQPLRLAEAERTLEQQVRLIRDPFERLQSHFRMLEVAQRADDTARFRRAAESVIARADSLPAARRQTLESGLNPVVIAHTLLAQPALLDSLRRSTPGYVSLMRSLYTRVFGQQAMIALRPLGDRAALLTGEFWFRREPANAPRPTHGRVALVVFLGTAGCQNPLPSLEAKWSREENCWGAMAMLRRLAQRFPSVEVTLATETRGYFASAAIEAPAEEAELLRRWLLEGHRLPGALSVSVTPFRRLPDPDRRRIDGVVPNAMNYRQSSGVNVFLIDADGLIVLGGAVRGEEEPRWAGMIEALLSRGGGKVTGG
jgi:hypothetical protein